MTPGRPHQQR